MNKWNFPSAERISINGFNNIGEEFKDNPLPALAKEICQNSLDTKFIKEYSNGGKTIKVTFDEFWIDSKSIPGYEEFVEVFEKEYKFNNDFYKNDKEVPNFYKNGLEVLKSERIRCLRIADYNTTGLIGSNEKQSSPWCNLTKNAGVSDKPEGSGGSKGKGKFASFICSSLYTVFYRTYAKDGLKASCGIARLSGYDLKDGTTALGEGYYESDEELFRIPELLNLEENYPRTEYGTDIYIIGFKDDTENWKKKIIASVIDNFFLAVFKNDLEIDICHGDYILNQSNIEDYMQDEEIKNYLSPETPYYYEILKNDKEDVITEQFSLFNENDLTEKLRVDDINDKYTSINTVAAVRYTGMKILDIKHLPRLGCYHGVLEMIGPKVNDYFRKLENATHNKWSASRSANPEEAQAMIDKLKSFVKDTIRKKLTATIKDEIDAEGMSELLPDDELFGDNNNEKQESLNDDVISKIEIRETPIKQNKDLKTKSDDGEDDLELDENGEIIKKKKPVHLGPEPGPHPNPNPRPEERYSKIKRRIVPSKMRMKNNEILFSTSIDEDIVKIELNISGDGYREKSNLTNVRVVKNNNPTNTDVKFDFIDNSIYLENVTAKDVYSIQYDMDNYENWTMEVDVYGNEQE